MKHIIIVFIAVILGFSGCSPNGFVRLDSDLAGLEGALEVGATKIQLERIMVEVAKDVRLEEEQMNEVQKSSWLALKMSYSVYDKGVELTEKDALYELRESCRVFRRALKLKE